MKPFLTGSRVYGEPTGESDIDLVVLVTPAVITELRKLADSDDKEKVTGDSDSGPQQFGGESASLRFGKLNLLCLTDLVAYGVWYNGTRILAREAERTRLPIERDVAIQFFDSLRRATGLWSERPTIDEARRYIAQEKAEKEAVTQWDISDSVEFDRGGVVRFGVITHLDYRSETCTVSYRGTDYKHVPLEKLRRATLGRGYKAAKHEEPRDDIPF